MGRFKNGMLHVNLSPDAGGGTGQTSTEGSKAGDQTGASIEGQGKGDQGQTIPPGTGEGDPAGTTGQTASSEGADDFKAKYESLLSVHTEMKNKEAVRKQKALEEQGKYEELYKTTDSELKTLKPRLETAEAALSKYVEAELKNIPDKFKPLVKGDTASAKLDSISELKTAGILLDQSKKATGDGSPTPGGNASPQFTDIYND